MSLPATFKAFDGFVANPSIKTFLGMAIAPVSGAILGELIDALIPRPQSERVMVFPEIDIPTLEYTRIIIEKPDVPTTPAPTEIPTSPMYPPAVGFRPVVEKVCGAATEYEVLHTLLRIRELVSKVATAYELALTSVLQIESANKVSAEYEKAVTEFITKEALNRTVTEFEIVSMMGTYITKTSYAGTSYDLLVSSLSGLHKYSYAKTLYDAYVAAVTKLSGISKVGTLVSLVPSIGVAITTVPASQVEVEAYMPQEAPPEEGGAGTSYEIQVVHPSSVISQTNVVGTMYEIGGTVEIALIGAIIYLGGVEYRKIETKHAFSEAFVIQGIVISKSEPENAIFDDWTILR